mmetsp:Transcript_55656/g.124358  ORF Transcript_55656/g.124358 Transcript_55656/m.124358 type:complete len:207 (+) Transcript_55656:610-1230(+)
MRGGRNGDTLPSPELEEAVNDCTFWLSAGGVEGACVADAGSMAAGLGGSMGPDGGGICRDVIMTANTTSSGGGIEGARGGRAPMRVVDSCTFETDVVTPSDTDSVPSNAGLSTASTILALSKLDGVLTAMVIWASCGPSQSMSTSSAGRPGIASTSAFVTRASMPTRRRRKLVVKCSRNRTAWTITAPGEIGGLASRENNGGGGGS